MKIRRVPVLAVGSVAVAVVVAGAGTAAADTGSGGSWTSTEVGPAAAGSDGWAVTEVAERSASAGGVAGRDVSSRPVAPVTSGQRPRSVSRARRPWRPAVVCRVGRDGGVWTVRQGDTLTLISRCTGLGLFRLIEAGDITDPDMLRIGQRIEIPAPQAARTTRTATPSRSAAPSAVPSRSAAPSTPSAVPVATQATPSAVPVAVAPVATPSRSVAPVATPSAVPSRSTTQATPVAAAPVVAVVTVTVTVAPAGVRR